MEGPREKWLYLLEREGVPSGPVRRVEDLMTDPQVLERGTVVELDHPRAGKIRTLGSTLHLGRTPTSVGEAPPIQGEHGSEVLTAIGYSEHEIEMLIKREVLQVPA
jgi:crotonobetainyl-CoA:carnitine CoA-transferase CaiB-like acyl-CoA transferase